MRLVRGFHFDSPDDEAIDAFVLTLRFFIQDNEPTSLRNTSKLYASLPINPSHVARFGGRRAPNALLDSPAFISINGESLSCRRLVIRLSTVVVLMRIRGIENYRLWMNDEVVMMPYLLVAFCIVAMNFAGVVSESGTSMTK